MKKDNFKQKLQLWSQVSFKGLRLNLYGFYLVMVIPPLLMKFHIKPLSLTKTHEFCQDLYGYDLFSYRRDYVSTSTE